MNKFEKNKIIKNDDTKININTNSINNDKEKEKDKNITSNKMVLLNFKDINNNDFQSEFMNHYDEFSPSWRLEADKMRK